MKTGKCPQPWIILVKLVSLTTTRLGRRYHPFRKPVLQSPQGEQTTVAITGLNPCHRYRIFGATAVDKQIPVGVLWQWYYWAIFWSLFWCWEKLVAGGPPRSKLWLALGHLPSDGLSLLFLNSEFPAAPLWQQCPWGLLEGWGKTEKKKKSWEGGGNLGQGGQAKACPRMHSGGASPVFLWWVSGAGGMQGVWQLCGRCSSLLALSSGWANWFSYREICSVVVQHSVPVPTYCTGSDLSDSSVFQKDLRKKSIH